MLEAVVDNNVFISGLLKGKTTRPVIISFTEERFKLISSRELINELLFTLEKAKFDRLIPKEDKIELIALIEEKARIVTTTKGIPLCRDPKDNKFIEAAIEAKAKYIVSVDNDLLEIPPGKLSFFNLKVLTPQEFLNLLNK